MMGKLRISHDRFQEGWNYALVLSRIEDSLDFVTKC